MTAKYKAFDYAAENLFNKWCEYNTASFSGDYMYQALRSYLVVLNKMEDDDGSN
jgi:hypothetical protein